MNIIKSQIESLLFISAKPMSVKQLAGLIKKKENEVKEAAEGLVEDYKTGEKGVRIIKDGFKYQMVSSPENAEVIKEFVKDETSGELTRPSLETLTIIAYRGPVAKTDLILRNLLMRGLVEAKQDKQKGETYYTVTFDFIRFLGINSVEELPDFERLSKDDAIDRMLEGEGNNENG
jgi:segregation and condensation protein B